MIGISLCTTIDVKLKNLKLSADVTNAEVNYTKHICSPFGKWLT